MPRGKQHFQGWQVAGQVKQAPLARPVPLVPKPGADGEALGQLRALLRSSLRRGRWAPMFAGRRGRWRES